VERLVAKRDGWLWSRVKGTKTQDKQERRERIKESRRKYERQGKFRSIWGERVQDIDVGTRREKICIGWEERKERAREGEKETGRNTE
jgi:hypothetical protein